MREQTGRRFALAVMLAWMAVRPARAGAVLPSETDQWIRVQTAHFVIYSNAAERRALDMGHRLERFRAALARFNAKFRIDPPVTTSIYIFKDDASLTPYKPRFNGRPIELSGLFVGHPDGYYILVNGAKQGDPLGVIYHEYTHHFVNNNLHNVPAWFGEGLAECYGTFRADAKTASIGLTQTDHVAYLREHDLIPLRNLFAMTTESPDYNEGERRGVFYAESWALMHYLLWDKPERKPQFVRFLNRLGRGEDPDIAFPASFETTYETFENELRNYVRQGRFLYTAFTIADLQIDDAVKVTPMKREEVLFRLGDVLLHVDRDRVIEAEDLFREARRLAPGFASAYAGLAQAASLRQRYDEAVPLFEKAQERDPGDPMTCFHFAQCLAERSRSRPAGETPPGTPSDIERAQELLGKAIGARPDFAEAYLEYARTLMEQGGAPGPAIHLLEAARPLLPSRADVVVNLAALYARKGDSAGAHALVENVLARMDARDAVEEANGRIRMEEDYRAAVQSAEARQVEGRKTSEESAGGGLDDGLSDPAPLPPAGSLGGAPPDYVATYNKQVAVYNQAVVRANQRDYDGAIAMLEDLLKQVHAEDLRTKTTTLLERLRADAARQRNSRQ